MNRRVVFKIRSPDAILLRIANQDEIQFKIADPIVKSEILPSYDGPYEITPTETVQILDTKNKSLTDVITVGPVPHNYGLITYNGAYILVS